MTKIKFTKPALSVDKQVELLKERKLEFENEEKARHYLQHIWYFRLTWYFKFYQDKETNKFHDGTTFEQVKDLYVFDRKLRLLTLDSIEKIEVSFKANINDCMSNEYGCNWFNNINLFSLETDKKLGIYENFIERVDWIQKKSSSMFIKAYFEKYDEEYLPSWMLFEELTIWEVSNIYRLLGTKLKQKIADKFSLYQLDFQIWIHLLVYIRNVSAHHSRLWNKEYIVKPRIKDKKLWDKYITYINKDNIRVVIPNYYNVALIINYLLNQINRSFSWVDGLEKLFDEHKLVPKEKIWFTGDWKKCFI